MILSFTYTEDFTPCGVGILSTAGIELYAVAGGLLIRRRVGTLLRSGVSVYQQAEFHSIRLVIIFPSRPNSGLCFACAGDVIRMYMAFSRSHALFARSARSWHLTPKLVDSPLRTELIPYPQADRLFIRWRVDSPLRCGLTHHPVADKHLTRRRVGTLPRSG